MITLWLLVILLSGYCEAGDFVATNEWQEIKEGQSIGKGLHVRMNLQTGIKEAKLMDENAADSSGGRDNRMAVSKLPDKKEEDEPSEHSTVSGRFRSMDELREFMPGMDVKTEGQIMTDKMNQLSKENSDPSIIVILEELEELAHKIDNGQLLVSQGWMPKIAKFLYTENKEVYRAVVRLISSAAQSNPTVQKYCIEQGYLGVLTSQLLSQPETLSKSTIFAISAILRNFPVGWEAFAGMMGFNTLTTKYGLSSLVPLQRSILTLYNDILEQDHYNGKEDVLGMLRPGSKVLCSKTAELLETANADLLVELVSLYSFIKGWCLEDQRVKIRIRLEDLTVLLSRTNDQLDDDHAVLLSRINSLLSPNDAL